MTKDSQNPKINNKVYAKKENNDLKKEISCSKYRKNFNEMLIEVLFTEIVFETETDKLQNFENTFTILLFYILFN